MLKTKMLFFTDCFVFGGCEKPVFEVLTSDRFNSQYDPLLIYRYSDEYYNGLCLTYPNFSHAKTKGIRFPEFNSWHIYLKRKLSKHPLVFRLVNRLAWISFRTLFPLIFIYEFVSLYFIFRLNRTEVLHINNGGYPGALACRIAAIAAKLAGIKQVLFNIHNMPAENQRLFDHLLDSLVGKSVTFFITGSKALGKALVLKVGFDERKMLNIYHGVSPLVAKAQTENDLHGRKDDFVLMIARFEERKGHPYLITAFKQLLSDYPQYAGIKLVLIGDGPTLPSIKRIVANEKLEEQVVFLGYRKDYSNYLANCLFLLNPSLGSEDLPYIILEAMSFGVPVIGTNVAGIPEEIEDGISGIVISPGDTGKLKLAIHTLLLDPALRGKMGEAAKQRFYENFTLEKMVDNYNNLYGSLC